MDLRAMSCCGFKELSGLSYGHNGDPAAQMRDFHARATRIGFNFGCVLFTATARAKYGRTFAAYITEHKLGELTVGHLALNPNTGHKVQGWIWAVDKPALAAWAKAHP